MPHQFNSPRTGGPHSVHGKPIDRHTRCVHYGTVFDIVAIRFYCCELYYPCHLCHDECANHPAMQWPVSERTQKAILCGECAEELSVTEYLEASECPSCGSRFNEGCRLHSLFYFEPDSFEPDSTHSATSGRNTSDSNVDSHADSSDADSNDSDSNQAPLAELLPRNASSESK